jgi:hypothetical protein
MRCGGEMPSTWLRLLSIAYHKLDSCFKTIQKRLAKLPKYAALHPDKRAQNYLGVFLNKILCQSENSLLQEAIQLVGGPRIVAPMFESTIRIQAGSLTHPHDVYMGDYEQVPSAYTLVYETGQWARPRH